MAVWDCTPNGVFNTTSFTPAIRSAMNTAAWSTQITLTNNISSYSGYNALIANGNGGLWILNGQIRLFDDEAGADFGGSGGMTSTAGATLTVSVDPVARTISVSGGLTGNGTFSWSAGTHTIFASGSVGVGRYTDGSYGPLAGTVGDVTYTSGSYTLAADAGSVAVTGTAAGLRAARLLAAAAFAFVITGTSAGLTGPTAYTVAANAGSLAVTGTAATLSQTRVLAAAAGACAITGTDAALAASGGLELGNHGFVGQIYGAGGTPARVTMSVTAGSAILVGRGGKISDFSTVPTASVGTFRFIDQARELTDWTGYGSAMYILRGNTGGTNVNFDCNVTSFDEHSVHVTELSGVNTVHAHVWNQVANAGAQSTQSLGSITIDRETVFVVDWWGAHPVGGGDHVVSATLNGVAMTDLGGWTEDNLNGYVQTKRFYLIVSTPGTYSTVVSHSPTQGAMLRMVALQPDRILSADAGAVAVTGASANLSFTRAPLAANAGTVAISGTDATLSRQRIVTADAGAVALAGTNAGLLAARIVAAVAGELAIAAVDADLRRGRSLGADASSYAIAGADAGIRATRALGAAAAAFSVTGTDASLSKSTAGQFTIAADSGAIAVTGSNATLRWSGLFIPSVEVGAPAPTATVQPSAATATVVPANASATAE